MAIGFKTLYRNVDNMFQYMRHILESKLMVTNALQTSAGVMATRLRGVEALAMGKLSPEMVHPTDLQIALRKVKHYLVKHRPIFKLVHEDLAFYFTHHLTMFSYTKDNIFIHFSVPTAEMASLFDVYRV